MSPSAVRGAPARALTRARRLLRTLPAAALAALVVVVGPAGAAWGHDTLVGTDPADGSVVTDVGRVVLQFSADQVPVGAAVEVTDAEGQGWAEGPPTVAGDTVTQPVPADLPPGDYRVVWRSVSGDGHPLTGELTFTVEGGADLAPPEEEPAAEGGTAGEDGEAAAGGAVGSGSASPAPVPVPEEAAPVAPTTPEESRPAVGLLVGLALVAVAAAVVGGVVRRRRSAR